MESRTRKTKNPVEKISWSSLVSPVTDVTDVTDVTGGEDQLEQLGQPCGRGKTRTSSMRRVNARPSCGRLDGLVSSEFGEWTAADEVDDDRDRGARRDDAKRFAATLFAAVRHVDPGRVRDDFGGLLVRDGVGVAHRRRE